ncbi:MAG TPA: DUF4097 family beta strand repeat-containing protein [Pedobacter sp.]|jgi:DUF4097 and DUF4098 domain-containing protein YvlB
MKKFFLLFVSITSGFVSTAQTTKDLFLTRSLTGETIERISAKTSGGSIDVTGISTGESRLEVYVHANNVKNNLSLSKEEIQKRMKEDYDLSISIANNQLNVTAKQKNGHLDWKRSLNISFKFFVNSSVSTDLLTSGGSINLSNLKGKQNFTTSGGSLDLDKLSGKIEGKTSGGSIRVTNSDNDINLKTSGGSIKAANCKGNIKLFTSGGSLNFTNLSGKIESRTSGGSIYATNISGEFSTHTAGGQIDLVDMKCSLDASTSGGSIDVATTTLGKYIKLATSSGSVDLQLPAKLGLDLNLQASKIKVNTLNNFSGTKEDDVIKGTLNGGGIPVEVRTSSGRISIDFK